MSAEACAEDKHCIPDNIGYANIWYLGRGKNHVLPKYKREGPFGDEWDPCMPNANVCYNCLERLPTELIKNNPHHNLDKIVFGITTASMDVMGLFPSDGSIKTFRETMKFISQHAMKKYMPEAYKHILKEAAKRRNDK